MIKGSVKNKFGVALTDVVVELKKDDFETVYSAKSDENGYFTIEGDGKVYPYLTAVKEYGTEYLEYWCRNINSSEEIELDIIIDKLEVYGLSAFTVGGGYDSVMVYFRPMSLPRFKNGDANICPDINKICAMIDGKESEVLVHNIVKEYIGESEMDAYLIQIKKSDNTCSEDWKCIDIKIIDNDVNVGMAKLIR